MTATSLKTCNKGDCDNVIDLAVDETDCGYGKCVEHCASGCLHRRYFNSQSPAGQAKIEYYESKGQEYLAR